MTQARSEPSTSFPTHSPFDPEVPVDLHSNLKGHVLLYPFYRQGNSGSVKVPVLQSHGLLGLEPGFGSPKACALLHTPRIENPDLLRRRDRADILVKEI